MKAKIVAFVGLAVVLAALFIRLGFWQLDRLAERRARNAGVSARLAEPIVPFDQLRVGDTSGFRRATLTGSPDYDNEILYTGRSRNGSPGVYLLTPVRRASNDTAVIVIRGWVYAPDAATIEAKRWREARTTFAGYLNMLLPSGSVPQPGATGRKVRTLTFSGVQGILPYPAARLYMVSQDSASDSTPARLPPPALDNGPHLSYAIQWFAFAAIALVGAAIVALRDHGAREASSTGA